MSSLLYKGHSIIYGAAFDQFTGRYAPTAQIVWHGRKGKHGTSSFTLSELFDTASDAKAVALKGAICWADERLKDEAMDSKTRRSITRAAQG
jgi:hypothetical protein